MNKKPQWLLRVMGLVVVICFVFGGNVSALTLDSEGNYQLGGYLRNTTGVRLTDGVNRKGKLSISRNELWLDFSGRFSDELQFNAIGRGHYEASYDLDNDIDQRPDGESTVPGPDELDHVRDWDFREYYFTYSPGNFVLKAGRQQVAWGEADAIRIADIINPLDLSWRWSFPAWEEIRVPLHMVNAAWNVPDSARDLRLEAVYVPADFRPHQFAPEGANWSLWDNQLAGFLHAPIFGTQERDLPDRDLSNGQGGARLRARFGEWDTTFFVYYQRDPLGVFTDLGSPDYAYHFPYVTTVGGTFNVYSETLETVFRSEYGYIFDQPYSAHPGSNDGSVPFNPDNSDYKEADTFHVMFGFDHNAWLRWLNPTKTFFFSGQWYQKYILDIDKDKYLTFLGDDDAGDYQTILSLLINTEYYEGKIVPQVLGVSFVTEESGFLEATLAYKPTYTLSFTVGYLNIWGNTNRAGLYFGPVKDNDEVYAQIKWSF